MIKSSKISFKHTNVGKAGIVARFVDNYSLVLRDFVDILWEMKKVPALLPKELTILVDPRGLSARAVQAAAKQASGIVRGTKAKHDRRLYVLHKLVEEGDEQGAARLTKALERNPVGKPDCSSICPELDSRFCAISQNTDTSFELWLTLSSLGKPFGKIDIPFNKTKHFNRMLDKGSLKTGIRLSKSGVTFMFEIPEPPKKAVGSTLGIDIGQREVISASNGFQPGPNKHGHTLSTITSTVARKRKGSNGFKRACSHRDNYINWSINQLDLSGVKQVNRENIKNLRKGKSCGRRLSHWTYPAIIGKLESRCQELGVLVNTVDPAYTSQRCYNCGFTRKGNRKGSLFKCSTCGYTADADLNASLNISLDLAPNNKDRSMKLNRRGFYWQRRDGSL